MRLVDYLIAHDGPPAPSGAAYDYVLSADGLWVQGENEHMAARVPIARVEVRGLAALHPVFTLKHGRIPHPLGRTSSTWREPGRPRARRCC